MCALAFAGKRISSLCLPISVHHTHAWWPRCQETVDSLRLELQMVGGHHVGAGTRTRVLWTNSQCSKLLGPYSPPYLYLSVLYLGAGENGSGAKSTECSSRGHRLDSSTYIWCLASVCTPSSRSSALSCPPWVLHTHMVHHNPSRQNHMHIK